MFRTLSALLVLSSAACVTAADPPKAKGPGQGTKYAFLVGCGEYDKNELRPVPFAPKETEEFRKVLLKTGFDEKNVKLLCDGAERRMLPEKKKIVAELDLLLARVTADDTVVVLLNGHGVHFKGDSTGYFCPVDAKLSDKSTLMPMDGAGGVFESLKACKAKRKLLVVNACRNDPRSDLSLAGNKIDIDDEDKEEVPEGIVALYSCRPGERSYYYDPTDARSKGRERSLFMHHLIEGWGAGGRTTLEDVFKRVREGAAADADALFQRMQNPVIRREYRGEWAIAGPTVWPGEDDFQKGFAAAYGVGRKIDLVTAGELFRTAAAAGHPLAKVEVARTHRTSGELEKAIALEKAAFPLVLQAAQDGDATAQDYAGFMYRFGMGVPKSDTDAVTWYQKAAAQNHADALCELAYMYNYGLGGLKEDATAAVRCYQKAAAQKFPRAYLGLGVKAEAGEGGLTKSAADAAKWYRLAADLDDSEAQHNLALLYEMGNGVPQSDKIAVYWYKRAADLGHARGQAYYGWMLMDGRGKLKANDVEAVGWYTKAADQGDGYGEYLLGFMHEEGRGGLKKSEAKAVEWYTKAADKNVAPAKDALTRLKK